MAAMNLQSDNGDSSPPAVISILVTGSEGFMGRNLVAALRRFPQIRILEFDRGQKREELEAYLLSAELIFHLAGVNRPQTEEEFKKGNTDFTQEICNTLLRLGKAPEIVFSSSIQAALDNQYGASKRGAEEALEHFHSQTGAPVCIYRLPNVFGKWSRPNYNTVVATFCHNIARGMDIAISDPGREMELVYIDDVINEFLKHLERPKEGLLSHGCVGPSYRITLGDLVARIRRLHDIQASKMIPRDYDDFMRRLHATYLSFLPEETFAAPVKLNTDNRGWLFELIKAPQFGQIFVSRTLPGITRGNHYHDSKLEKFCVIQGKGVIKFRQIDSEQILEYPVDGNSIRIVDIPPGYTHSIENIGKEDMICLFWANEIFSPEKADTYFLPVVEK